MINAKQKPAILIMIVFLLTIIIFISFRNNATFVEYEQYGDIQGGSHVTITDTTTVISQEFSMPYPIFHGVQLLIGTYARDNNSDWIIRIIDRKNGKELYKWVKNACWFSDNVFHYFEAKRPLIVETDALYVLEIQSTNCVKESGLAFYVSNNEILSKYIKINNEIKDTALVMRVCGGFFDARFWIVLTLLILITALSFFLRIYKLHLNKLNIIDDIYIQSFLVGIVCFLLFSIWINAGAFVDESMKALFALFMTKGLVLSRDVLIQHPPATTFLLYFYALLGALNTRQMRILYYITISLVFALLYLRHKKVFGKRIIVIFLSLIALTYSNIDITSRILDDNTAAVCMLALFLEFARYCGDKELPFSRCVIVGLCVFGSVASTFIMVYPVFILICAVIYCEIKYWIEIKRIDMKALRNRYSSLIIMCCLPFVLMFVYFFLNRALEEFIRQCYSFNREIYSKYVAGFGTMLLQPFVDSIYIFSSYLSEIFNKDKTSLTYFNFSYAALLLISTFIIMLKGKKPFFALSAFIITILGGSRGGFHATQYYILIPAVAVYATAFMELKTHASRLAFICLLWTLLSGKDLSNIGNLVKKPVMIMNNTTARILKMTEPTLGGGGGNPLFVYIVAFDADHIQYLLYKDRPPPVNRILFLIPWNMDWYEDWCIEDLDKAPILIWSPAAKVWNIENFNPRFKQTVMKNFVETAHNIWIKKTNVVSLEISFEDVRPIAGVMLKNISFSQAVKLDAFSRLMSVEPFIGTYTRENTSKIKFDIIDMSTNHIVFSKTVDTKDMKDNAFHKIDLPFVEVKKGAMYEFRFTSLDGTKGNAVTIYTTGKGKTTDASYGMINGERQDFNFRMKISGAIP
jgi:hypothetical protein